MVESLHLSTSMVLDLIVVSNPIGGTTHLSMICRSLRISMLGVEFESDEYMVGFKVCGLILEMD